MLSSSLYKNVSFPADEYKEYGIPFPVKFEIENILEFTVGGLCSLMIASELYPSLKITPSWNRPHVIFLYSLSDFEKENFEKLSQIQKDRLLRLQKYNTEIKFRFFDNEISGNIETNIILKNELNLLEIEFKVNFNGQYNFNFAMFNTPQEANEVLKEKTSILYYELIKDLLPKKIKTSLISNSHDSYLNFATAHVVQELRRIMTAKKINSFGPHEIKTKNGLYAIEISGIELNNVFDNLSDLSVDILNALVHLWLCDKKDNDGSVIVNIDDLLFLKNLKKNPSNGRRGGFKEAQREEIIHQLDLLSRINLRANDILIPEYSKSGKRFMKKVSEQSPIFYIEKFIKANYYSIKPGEILKLTLIGAGRQTGLLHKKIAEMDHYRFFWEKRIGNYLAWIWRNRQNKGDFLLPISVQSLLKEVKEKIDDTRPARTRTRLEKALYKLEEEGIIKDWQYSYINESELISKGWFDKWQNCKLVIEPPIEIIEEYKNINKKNKNNKSDYLIKTQKHAQARLAEELNISPGETSKILSGRKKLKKQQKEKIEKFLWQ